MTLLDECVKTLGKQTEILDSYDKKIVVKKLRKKVPIKAWEKINWEGIEDKTNLDNENKLKSVCEKGNYYIMWDNPQLPVVKTSLKNITKGKNIYSIIDVSFQTWLISEDFTSFVEFDCNGEITYKKFIEAEDYECSKKDTSIFKILKYLYIILIIIIIVTIYVQVTP